MFPVLAAANYDPQEFENPGEFLLDRAPNRHLSFGAGPHICLGLKLARAEVDIALQELWQRWPDLQADFDITQPNWSNRLGMRALKSLSVKI